MTIDYWRGLQGQIQLKLEMVSCVKQFGRKIEEMHRLKGFFKHLKLV